MSSILIDGAEYYPAREVAELWGIKESTVKRYAEPKTGKIPGCIKHDRTWYIPVTAIRPITRPVAQGLLWGIVAVKNDPASFLDLSTAGIDNAQLEAVLRELRRQGYLVVDFEGDDLRNSLVCSRITEKGFGLIRYRKRLNENQLMDSFSVEWISVALSAAQTILQLIQLS